jgi:L-lactate dehydrogenase complex protein LldF
LHELLLENRAEAVEQGLAPFGERIAWKVWKQVSLRRSIMNQGSAKIKSWMIRHFVKSWSKHRGELHFPEKSFNQMWREKKGG